MKVKTKETLPAVAASEPRTRKGITNLPALPEEWEKQLAVVAKDEAAVEQPSVQSFSLRAGVLSYNGQAMPDNKMEVIVLASSFENALFINKFDPNNIISPLCFALSEDGEDMEPHEQSFKKQNPLYDKDWDKDKPIPKDVKIVGHSCTGCPHAEWGSDTNSPSGRGKACKEVRRLAVMPASALEEGIEKSAIAMLRVPVTSVRNWAEYVHTLAAVAKRPSWTVITEISLVPNAKTQFQVNFTAVDAVANTKQIAALQLQRTRALQSVMNPYAMMTQEQFDEITAEASKPAKKRKF